MSLFTPSVTTRASKRFTFTGAAGFGALGACTIFTVSGGIHVVSIDATVVTTLTVNGGTGTSQLSLGVTNGTADFIALTNSTALTSTDRHWVSATPTADSIPQVAAMKDIVLSQNIIGTSLATAAGTQIITGGVIDFTVIWYPTTTGASLVAA